ncbi:hypothetical protein SNE40_000333 [Patella caerulea]|uniref:cholesterol 7-desaturase n=1 Tax=Patella caerulea TaxID=87958 RepID=A0AAN8Q1E9_PATCE
MAVSATVTDRLLTLPLFEVGGLWLKAVTTIMNRTLTIFTTMPDWYSWTTYVYLLAATLMCYGIYIVFFTPLNRIRKLCDVGYLTEGDLSKKEIANNVMKRRMVGDIPPVYPNGWFGLIESFRLKRKEVKSIDLLGLNLAVFRDEKGEVHALDAYCPHMGANFAAGGRVIDDGIECPFHAWRFRGEDGKCTHIPYCQKIPEIAKVKSWPILEINGWIYLWHHAEGIDPTWLPPELEDIANGTWTYRGRTEHLVNSHIEEIPQNGADVVHLAHVHGPLLGAGVDLRYMWSKLWGFGHHEWQAEWEPQSAPNEHIGVMRLGHSIQCFGNLFSIIGMNVTARQIGPGIVYMEFTSSFCKGVYIQSLTPVEPLLQKLVHNVYVHWTIPTFIGKFFLWGEAVQVERDIMIWNNKRYESKPLLVKSSEDSLTARHKRWFSQFYSKNSKRFTFQRDNLDW